MTDDQKKLRTQLDPLVREQLLSPDDADEAAVMFDELAGLVRAGQVSAEYADWLLWLIADEHAEKCATRLPTRAEA
jgi:hypothetical protein